MTGWRYRCPDADCRSVQLRRRQPGETMNNGRTAPAKWYCRGCKEHFGRRYDAKTGNLVA